MLYSVQWVVVELSGTCITYIYTYIGILFGGFDVSSSSASDSLWGLAILFLGDDITR